MKNKHASELGKLSAKKRERITNYSELGKKTWANVSPEERKARMAKVRMARKVIHS